LKVKISYAVDLSEVPDVIRQLVTKNDSILSELIELSANLCVGDYGIAAHKKLARLAEKTSLLSESYSDCASILSGFLGAMVPALEPEGAAELREKIDKLKEASEEINNVTTGSD